MASAELIEADLAVVGAGAAGLFTAITAAREGARVAAVRGSDADIRARMQAASTGSLSGGWTFTKTPIAGNPVCNDNTAGQEVTIKINNASLSGAVKEAFDVSIPFLPPITLNPTLSGTFRCE